VLVSISGPPQSGKTTLYDALRTYFTSTELYPRPRFSSDVVRQSIARLGVDLAEADRLAFQHYVGFRHLVTEAEFDAVDLTILDKSLIDAVSYWDVLVGGRRPVWASLLTPERYGLVVLCSHEGIQTRGGDIDVMHADLRDSLASQIAVVAREASHCVVRVTGDRDERLAAAAEAIIDVVTVT
jgi:nicotinamide riboside kinase